MNVEATSIYVCVIQHCSLFYQLHVQNEFLHHLESVLTDLPAHMNHDMFFRQCSHVGT